MKQQSPLDRLKHHVTGAIERGEKTAIVEQPAMNDKLELLNAKLLDLEAFIRANFPYEVMQPESNNPVQPLYFELRKVLYQIKKAPDSIHVTEFWWYDREFKKAVTS